METNATQRILSAGGDFRRLGPRLRDICLRSKLLFWRSLGAKAILCPLSRMQSRCDHDSTNTRILPLGSGRRERSCKGRSCRAVTGRRSAAIKYIREMAALPYGSSLANPGQRMIGRCCGP